MTKGKKAVTKGKKTVTKGRKMGKKTVTKGRKIEKKTVTKGRKIGKKAVTIGNKTGKKTAIKKDFFRHPFKRGRDVHLTHIKGFKLLKQIGKGSFGKVFKAENLRPDNNRNRKDSICALKFVDLNDREGEFSMEGIITEWLASENIGPSFIGCWSVPSEGLGVLASDLWDGTLDDFMHNNDRRVVPELVMDKITDQVNKLHNLDHVHLDLHGANVLVKWDKTGGNVVDATITDFGKTTHVHQIEPERLELPIDLFNLKPTRDPKSIDRQLVKQIRGDYK